MGVEDIVQTDLFGLVNAASGIDPVRDGDERHPASADQSGSRAARAAKVARANAGRVQPGQAGRGGALRVSKPKVAKPKLVANPPHGEKGDFVKVTVTLPPDVYELIAHEVTRRKKALERNPQLSAVIREAVVKMLTGRSRPSQSKKGV